MCGFAGCFAREGSTAISDSLEASLSLLEHRGPDSTGKSSFKVATGHLQLGFKRLAIIDLTESANQPFTSSDLRFDVVFNGEIYNFIELKKVLSLKGYVFRTNSDTEVLLHAWREWGISALEKFIGMFSIVIFDRVKNEIWCIRDAYGIKPFFYSWREDYFIFASEIPALLKLRKGKSQVNEDVALKYLIDGDYDRSSNTFFSDVLQLEPGHYMKIDLNEKNISIESKRWWFPGISQNSDITFKAAAEALRAEFLESVKLHLRSDVKIATALSGGLDSSAIVSAIRSIEPEIEINTFSYLASDSSINEKKWVDLVNLRTESFPHLVEISPSSFYADLDDLIQSQGEPFGSTSLYAQFKIYEAARASGVTVMLDGQGADELLAGYHGYPESRIRSLLEKHQYKSAVALASNWSAWPGRDLKFLMRSSANSLLPRGAQDFLNHALQGINLPKFIKRNYHSELNFSDVYPTNHWKSRRLSQRLLKEQSNGALSALLRHADRNSMRWSIESRVPFLNIKMTELVLSFPEEFLLSPSGETKSVFREAMRGIVDQRVLERKDKIGFATPQEVLLEGNAFINPEIADSFSGLEFLDRDSTMAFLLRAKDAKSSGSSLRWRTFNLLRWNQLFMDN